jgi:uncharacterized membrane protein
MAKIEKTIFVNAPVEKVFAYMADPMHQLEIWPSMQEVKNVQHFPDGGHSFDWVYKMAGLRFEGHTETTEFVENQRVVARTKSGISSTFVWTYQPEHGGTRVNVAVDYSIPGNILGRLSEPIIHKMNEQEGETILANLKARMEG